jgi:hypothetical protein
MVKSTKRGPNFAQFTLLSKGVVFIFFKPLELQELIACIELICISVKTRKDNWQLENCQYNKYCLCKITMGALAIAFPCFRVDKSKNCQKHEFLFLKIMILFLISKRSNYLSVFIVGSHSILELDFNLSFLSLFFDQTLQFLT